MMPAITGILMVIMPAIAMIMPVMMIVAAAAGLFMMIVAAIAMIMPAAALLILFREFGHGPGDGFRHLLFHDGGDDIFFPNHYENGLIPFHFDVGDQELSILGIMLQHGIAFSGVGHQRSYMKTENPPVRGG